MEKATRFKKARIIALDAGVFLGSVARLILDLETRQVAGLLIEGGQHAIDGEDVRALGEDAVTVTTAARIIDLGEAEELAAFIRNEDEVYRKEVFTVAGKKVGFITDVLIDSLSKQIVGFEMFSEFLFEEEVHGVILLNNEVIFGRDLVLVPSDIERLIARSDEYVQPPAPTAAMPSLTPVLTPLPTSHHSTHQTGQSLSHLTGQPSAHRQPRPLYELEQPEHRESVEETIPLELPTEGPTVVDFTMGHESEPVSTDVSAGTHVETQGGAQFGTHVDRGAGAESGPQFGAQPGSQFGAQAGPHYDEAQLDVASEDDNLTEDVAIDFSGVEVPTPEIIREAPEQTGEVEDGENKPDMEKIFASFPLGVQEDDQGNANKPSGFTFGEAPHGQPEVAPFVEDVVEEPPPPPEPEKPASPKDKLIRFVLGKTSSRDIFDVDGNLILGKGQEITEDVVRKAQAAELMPQVFLAASQGLHSRLKRG